MRKRYEANKVDCRNEVNEYWMKKQWRIRKRYETNEVNRVNEMNEYRMRKHNGEWGKVRDGACPDCPDSRRSRSAAGPKRRHRLKTEEGQWNGSRLIIAVIHAHTGSCMLKDKLIYVYKGSRPLAHLPGEAIFRMRESSWWTKESTSE